jgi:hypothetical protein
VPGREAVKLTAGRLVLEGSGGITLASAAAVAETGVDYFSSGSITHSSPSLGHIRARDLIAFCAAIVVPMRPFLANGGHPPDVVNRMYDAWWKSMILQATLWAQPYVREGDF